MLVAEALLTDAEFEDRRAPAEELAVEVVVVGQVVDQVTVAQYRRQPFAAGA